MLNDYIFMTLSLAMMKPFMLNIRHSPASHLKHLTVGQDLVTHLKLYFLTVMHSFFLPVMYVWKAQENIEVYLKYNK